MDKTVKGVEIDPVKEKLIEILRKPIFPHELVDPIEAVADYLLDNGVTLDNQVASSKWISVKDRLPEDYTERVLVKINDANNIIGHPDMDTDRYMGEIWVRWGHNVTHWMPLPQPPKGD